MVLEYRKRKRKIKIKRKRKRKKRYNGSGHSRVLATEIIGSGHRRLPAATISTTYPLARPNPFQISQNSSPRQTLAPPPTTAAHSLAAARRVHRVPPPGRRGRTSPAGTAHHRAPSPSSSRAPSPSIPRAPSRLPPLGEVLPLPLPLPLPSPLCARYHQGRSQGGASQGLWLEILLKSFKFNHMAPSMKDYACPVVMCGICVAKVLPEC